MFEKIFHLFSSPKNRDNLESGQSESLLEMLRRSTNAELVEPNEELNGQIVETINRDVIQGTSCWDVVDMLKKLLHSSKAHKQWLAVQLMGRVLRECSSVLEAHQQELLLEVARVMCRPRGGDKPQGRKTRAACMELLNSMGAPGAHAFHTITRLDGAWAPTHLGGEHVPQSSLSVPEAASLPRPGSHLSLTEARQLSDVLRSATAKELPEPSEELGAQVVDMILTDISAGKDPREIAELLRQRLHSHKPHKQWLAVHLFGRVLRDCGEALAGQSAGLLEEVARTMMRPARPNSDEGKRTREAALALLQSFGPAGEAAVLSVNRLDGAWGSGETPHVDTHTTMAVPERAHVSHLTHSEARALSELLRSATAKGLEQPDEELLSHVVTTIKAEVSGGKDARDIAELLRGRLHSRQSHKQWLAVGLAGRVLRDCGEALAGVEVELLEEVARVMIRPARPESDEGKRTRTAAAELLRARGPVGTAALLAANRLDGAWGSGETPHVDTHTTMAVPERAHEVPIEERLRSSVDSLSEAAAVNAQLLRDLLVAKGQGAASTSNFDAELATALLARTLDH